MSPEQSSSKAEASSKESAPESSAAGRPSGVKLSCGKCRAELPILKATCGADSMDISVLTRETGLTALDYGFVNVASTESQITFIDGDEGVLRYRGYPIEEVAPNMGFLEVALLLLYGELPTAEESARFKDEIKAEGSIHEDMRLFFNAMPQDAHPMSVLSSGVSALSTYYQEDLLSREPEMVRRSIIRLLAKLPIVAAYAMRKFSGKPILYPDLELDYVSGFLRLCFGETQRPYRVNPAVSQALERLFILHEDHEQNASTSTVRLVGSTGANLYASVSAGISALFGPLHGGANEAVIVMLQEIRDRGISVESYLERVKKREKGVRLMGFGHRVYKNYDPRARLVKQEAERVLAETAPDDDLLAIASELERHALEDEYFVSRRLYPNVDFYTGIIYRAMGFPPEMFTVLFALGRLPGWVSHWWEMNQDSRTKIGRPQQLYTGYRERHLPS